jgi:hypothetical protein
MRITIECDSIDELNQLAARLGGAVAAVSPKVPAPKVEAPKVEAPKVEAPKDEAPKAAAPKEEQKTTSTVVAEISYAKDVAPRVLELAGMKLPDAPKAGREAAMGVMEKFGVQKAPQLKVEQYADFIVAVDAAIESIKAKA